MWIRSGFYQTHPVSWFKCHVTMLYDIGSDKANLGRYTICKHRLRSWKKKFWSATKSSQQSFSEHMYFADGHYFV